LGLWLGFGGLVRLGGRRLLGIALGSCTFPAFLRLRFAGALAVLPVVGDVEAATPEDQAGTARDFPGGHFTANRAFGSWLIGHLLELLEHVPRRTLVLVGRHGRSCRLTETRG